MDINSINARIKHDRENYVNITSINSYYLVSRYILMCTNNIRRI